MGTNYTRINDWGIIQIKQFPDASQINKTVNWKGSKKIPYQKYSVKESDMRIKTATFTSPQYLDLTTGLYAIRILSRYHENFAGVVLDVDYNEDTGLYDYQCQDFSRFYISKTELICKNRPIWKVLVSLITGGKIKFTSKKISRKGYQKILSGFRPLKMYNQSLYNGNIYKGNPLTKNISLIARDKSRIEIIRDIVFSQLGYFDVYFNDRGVLQIEPISKTDWENTGLHLTNNEFGSRKFKFSTTNSITGVRVNGSDAKAGKSFWTGDVLNIDLSAFFGNIETSIANPIQSSATKKKSNATNKTTAKNTDNPYGTKNKEVWVNMDTAGGGDESYLNRVCELLSKNGWNVHNMGVDPNIHTDPNKFSQCHDGIWWTIDNGMDPGTIRHLGYDDWCAGSIMRKGGRCVFACMMDNTKKYWVEKGCDNWYDLHEAWDDGYSSGDTYLRYPAGYMAWSGLPFMTAKNYDASGMVAQFLKGGCSQEALKMSNWKNHKGNYYVSSGWSSKY